MEWEYFKQLVKLARQLNTKIMRENEGSNSVTLDITIIDYDIMDWVSVNPFSIDLRTGYGTICKENVYHFNYYVKGLLARCHHG